MIYIPCIGGCVDGAAYECGEGDIPPKAIIHKNEQCFYTHRYVLTNGADKLFYQYAGIVKPKKPKKSLGE